MKRTYMRSLIIMGLLLLIVGAGIAVKGRVAQADVPVALDSQVDPAISQSQLVQAAPAEQPLNISVGLQMRNPDEFDSLLSAMYDPASPTYRQYLTPDQFTQDFAPTDDQVQQVESYIQDQGMTVTSVTPDNLLLDVQSTVGQAQQAFSVRINTYRSGRQTYYANSSSIRVPRRIRSLVTTIAGLDSYIKLHSNYQQASLASKTAPAGYTPKDVSTAYDISPLQSAGFLGDKQTIALFEMDGYLTSDITNYMQYFNPASLATTLSSVAANPLSASAAVSNLTNVMVDNYNGAAGTGAEEVSLDIEMVDAIAPHANILVYEGPNTTQGINDTYAKIINDNKAQIVSTSWGECEAFAGNTELQLLDNLFKQGTAQGMSFFSASGDAGAYDCGDTNLGVDSPSSDPYMTSVGGTTLQLNANSTIASESVWSDPNDNFTNEQGSGSGGGLSSYFSLPSWQKGSSVQNSYSNGKREVPDVTASADSNYGYAIYCTVQIALCSSTGWNDVGGTSSGAPLWAASTALINQYMQAQGKKSLGQINPVLYGLYNGTHAYPPFHDITTGDNLFYPATANYDMASGLGSPDVFNIARDLVINAGGTATTSASTATLTGLTLAQDTFQGSNQTYWGTSSSGQFWGGDANSSTVFSITNNSGQVTNGSTLYNAVLGPLAVNADVSFTGTLNTYTNNAMGAVLRWTDGNNWYRAYLDGASLIVQKMVLGIPTVLAAAPFTATAGTAYNVRFRIVGSTLYAVAWLKSGTQPTTWMIATTDSTFLTGYCGVDIQELSSNSTTTFTAFQATSAS
jgi:subtilase family serine protease